MTAIVREQINKFYRQQNIHPLDFRCAHRHFCGGLAYQGKMIVLVRFGYMSKPGAAVVEESYSGRVIDNVTPYFAHVNVAKCSMRDPNKRQAPRAVHETCSQSYLIEELKILNPDILVTQGKATNEILGRLILGKPILEKELPFTRTASFSGKAVLWMPMRHPTQQLQKIRRDWPTYARALKAWPPGA
jgi:hypothetical protein